REGLDRRRGRGPGVRHRRAVGGRFGRGGELPRVGPGGEQLPDRGVDRRTGAGARAVVRRAGDRGVRPGGPRGRRFRRAVISAVVGDTGIEPVTSSVSRKRSPTELIARGLRERTTGLEPATLTLAR